MLTHSTTAPLSDWIGRTDTQTGMVAPMAAQAVHATLTPHEAAPRTGEALPPLWHWYAFAPTVPMHDLQRDGHPSLGGFMPPIAQERRMWAGGVLTFHAPLVAGETLTRTSTTALWCTDRFRPTC